MPDLLRNPRTKQLPSCIRSRCVSASSVVYHQMLFAFNQHKSDGPGYPCDHAMAAAIVIVNWCTFFFAWEKPLDARSHILILIKATANRSTHHDRYQPRGPDTIVTEDFEREENLSGSQGTERRIQLEFPELQSTSISKYIASFRITPLTLLAILFWPMISFTADLSELIPRKSDSPLEFPDGTLKIPLFYVQNTMLQQMLLLPVSAVGTGMGIILCSLLLPEANLYLSSQATASSQAAVPALNSAYFSTLHGAFILGCAILANVFYLLTFPLSPADYLHVCLTRLSNLFQRILLSDILFLWPLLFFNARVGFLVASVIRFRSTPGEVFLGRSWVDYIPHFS